MLRDKVVSETLKTRKPTICDNFKNQIELNSFSGLQINQKFVYVTWKIISGFLPKPKVSSSIKFEENKLLKEERFYGFALTPSAFQNAFHAFLNAEVIKKKYN